MLNIQSIRCTTTLEVLEQYVPHKPASAVALNHESLVSAVRVYIPVDNILNLCTRAETPDSRAARLVAPNAFDEDVRRGRLHTDAFIPVSNGDVVDPVVRTPDVDTIGSTDISTSDDEVVNLAIGSLFYDDVEFGCYEHGVSRKKNGKLAVDGLQLTKMRSCTAKFVDLTMRKKRGLQETPYHYSHI